MAKGKYQRGLRRAGELQAMAANQSVLAQALDCWERQPERLWAWSDLHIGHRNILRYSGRPFQDIAAHDKSLLDAAGFLTGEDWLLFGGDVSLLSTTSVIRDWLRKIRARKVLIAGNHDVPRSGDAIPTWDPVQTLGFDAVAECLDWPNAQTGGRLWITHYPLSRASIPDNTLNVHGHIHQHLLDGPFLNISVEHTGYRPVRLGDLLR